MGKGYGGTYTRQIAGLEVAVAELNKKVARLEQEVGEARNRDLPALKPGDLVAYRPGRFDLWKGVVIPRPYGADALSPATLQSLTFVMREDGSVRGCFAHRLVRV